MMEAQVFVKIDNYKDVIDTVGLIKERLTSARAILSKIRDLKNQEDAELQVWETKLNDIESRVGEIDKVLFEPSQM